MPLDGALIDRTQDRLPILFRKRRRKRDRDPDASHSLAAVVTFVRHGEGEPVHVQVALLAEAERVETRARSDRGEEHVEWRGRTTRAAGEKRLIRNGSEIRRGPRPPPFRRENESPRQMHPAMPGPGA